MTDDDTGARKARAKRLRKQIKELTASDAEGKETPPQGEKDVSDAEANRGEGAASIESPREFIHRRMRHLGEGEKDPD